MIGRDDGQTSPLSSFAATIAELDIQVDHFNSHHSNNIIAICATLQAPWNKMNRLETQLQAQCQTYHWHLHLLHHENTTKTSQADENGHAILQERLWLPYAVHVVTAKQQHVLHPIIEYWQQAEAIIREVSIDTPVVAKHYRPTNALVAYLDIPCDQSMIALRDGFAELCDELNVDGMLEPLRWWQRSPLPQIQV